MIVSLAIRVSHIDAAARPLQRRSSNPRVGRRMRAPLLCNAYTFAQRMQSPISARPSKKHWTVNPTQE